MPIALERGNGIGRPGFVGGIGCAPIYESPVAAGNPPAGRKLHPPATLGVAVAVAEANSSSRSSSIGKDSDRESAGSGGEVDAGEVEVQSSYKGPLEMLGALEESLPMRRGISNFYCGKSKSFASLADVISSHPSSKDLVKPENAYTRKRRNLLALKHMWDRSHSNSLRSTGGGISKRPVNSSRSTLALAVAMSNSGSSSTTTNSEEEHDQCWRLPPLHPASKPAAGALPFKSSLPQICPMQMRSFSLMDLQGMAGWKF